MCRLAVVVPLLIQVARACSPSGVRMLTRARGCRAYAEPKLRRCQLRCLIRTGKDHRGGCHFRK
ncbi:hypothetical protein ACFPRL_30020 [Pseudoclavibacter helvolus]